MNLYDLIRGVRALMEEKQKEAIAFAEANDYNMASLRQRELYNLQDALDSLISCGKQTL